MEGRGYPKKSQEFCLHVKKRRQSTNLERSVENIEERGSQVKAVNGEMQCFLHTGGLTSVRGRESEHRANFGQYCGY